MTLAQNKAVKLPPRDIYLSFEIMRLLINTCKSTKLHSDKKYSQKKHKSEANDIITQLFNSNILSKKKKVDRCDLNSKTACFFFFLSDIYIQTMKGEKSKQDKDEKYTQPHTYNFDLPVQM